MVPRNGFEPSTVRVWTVCSSQLSYLGIGVDKRDRTADLRSASASLSQLSYIPILMVRLSGVEPPTSRLSGVCSNQLSYKRIHKDTVLF